LKAFAKAAAGKFREGKRRLREFRLFAKDKPKAVRMRLMAQMAKLVGSVQAKLATTLEVAEQHRNRLVGYAKVAHAKVRRLHQTMKTLLPQIRYWIGTGFVAANKIVSVHISELYSIVRGKIGKPVEFGLQWGIARLKGGFLLATLAANRRELVDSRFALQAVDNHIALFGKPPEAYAYDRAGHSQQNVCELKARGVKHVGLAPRGQVQWEVDGAIKEKLVRERAQVEGGIGAIKNGRYGFNRPAARSAAMMGVCGQRAVLGLNLNKLARGLAAREGMVLVG